MANAYIGLSFNELDMMVLRRWNMKRVAPPKGAIGREGSVSLWYEVDTDATSGVTKMLLASLPQKYCGHSFSSIQCQHVKHWWHHRRRMLVEAVYTHTLKQGKEVDDGQGESERAEGPG